MRLPHLHGKIGLSDGIRKIKKAPKQETSFGVSFDCPKGEWTPTIPSRIKWNVSGSIVNQLEKGIFEFREIQVDRLVSDSNKATSSDVLSQAQQVAFDEINSEFEVHEVVLLEGITGSGKTALYSKKIKACLEVGQQVLYLVSEISLTTQIVSRLKSKFHQLAVYHSKFNPRKELKFGSMS